MNTRKEGKRRPDIRRSVGSTGCQGTYKTYHVLATVVKKRVYVTPPLIRFQFQESISSLMTRYRSFRLLEQFVYFILLCRVNQIRDGTNLRFLIDSLTLTKKLWSLRYTHTEHVYPCPRVSS